MSLSIGIVGLPNVGKSTLFNALTRNNVLAANYPFATIEPNTGIVPMPDPRLKVLSELFGSAKTVPAPVTFVDIAGIVSGAHKGEGMGNAFLSHIRETDAIVQVIRAFHDDEVQHVDAVPDPKRDIETINTELILADLQTLETHLPKAMKIAKGDSKQKHIVTALEHAKEILESETLLSASKEAKSFTEDIKYLNLLTMKPFLYVFNLDEAGITDTAKQASLKELVGQAGSIFICAKLEAELSELEEADAKELMEGYGLKESGLEQLTRVGFNILKLQTFLTAGEKETKAWTIHQGDTAPKAAGVIHGDFERGFIAADIVSFADLVETGSWANARTAGRLRTEGKTYVMQLDDVVEFKFNV